MKKAIYPGSFDPITNGHIDIVNRAQTLFGEIHISVIENPSKTPLFSAIERIQFIQSIFSKRPGIFVESFQGLLVDYAKKKQIPTIIRGLRAVSDFDYEFQMALTNRHLYPEIDTVFLMTDEKYSYLSSSLVKQVAKYNGNISSFVPPEIKKALKDQYPA